MGIRPVLEQIHVIGGTRVREYCWLFMTAHDAAGSWQDGERWTEIAIAGDH